MNVTQHNNKREKWVEGVIHETFPSLVQECGSHVLFLIDWFIVPPWEKFR